MKRGAEMFPLFQYKKGRLLPGNLPKIQMLGQRTINPNNLYYKVYDNENQG